MGLQMFEHILVATDRVSEIEPVVLSALKLAAHYKAEFTLLHVLEVPAGENRRHVRHFGTGAKIVLDADYEKEVKQALTRRYSRFLGVYGRGIVQVKIGFPWLEILKTAHRKDVDLILLGPHRKTGPEHEKGKIGSTAEGVIRREPCPLWIVNQSVSPRMVRLKQVVVAIDFSESCRYALKYALGMAQAADARLALFHMLGVPPSPRYNRAAYEREVAQALERLENFCTDVPDSVDRVYRVRGGVHPHLEITAYAARKNADLIVMGSHGKIQERKWYVGSAVERVSQRARCPVAVVSDPKVLWPMDAP
jgi:nucleotide-binding universal stress UspA family protein